MFRRRLKILCFITLFCFYAEPMPVYAANLTLEEAYSKIGKTPVRFNKNITSMSAEEAEYLDHLFFMTDLAFRHRMTMMQYIEMGADERESITIYSSEIAEITKGLELLKPPNIYLKKVGQLVRSAIKDQHESFMYWKVAGWKKHIKNYMVKTPVPDLVQNSHEKLIKAYNILKRQYPDEPSHNMQAFYTHLCALDLI